MNSSNTSLHTAWDFEGNLTVYREPWGHLGAYTTLRIEISPTAQTVFFPAAHLKRLKGDLLALGVRVPDHLLSQDSLKARLGAAFANLEPGDWLLRLAVCEDHISLAARPVIQAETSTLTGVTQMYRRKLPEIKSLDYVEILRRMQPLKRSSEELILQDPDGRILEGATTNLLFWHQDGHWLAPDRGCLPGITRELLLPHLKHHAMVRFTDVTPPKLDRIDAILCCGSGREVAAFAKVNPFGWKAKTSEPLAIVREIYQDLKATTHDRLSIDLLSDNTPERA